MGTLLSHNAAALIAAGMAAGLAVILLIATRDVRGLLASAGGGVLGLALSAWFWLPALLEGKYVALDRIVASDFRPRFIALEELIALSPRLDSGAINPYFPLTWGAVQVWLGALGALLFVVLLALDWLRPAPQAQAPGNLRTNPILSGAGVFFILFTAFCGFMATAWSEPVWTMLPFVDLFEWPFRWHGFTAVGLAWLCAFVVYAARRAGVRAEAVAGILALALLIGSALVNLYPHKLAAGRPLFAGRSCPLREQDQGHRHDQSGRIQPDLGGRCLQHVAVGRRLPCRQPHRSAKRPVACRRVRRTDTLQRTPAGVPRRPARSRHTDAQSALLSRVARPNRRGGSTDTSAPRQRSH